MNFIPKTRLETFSDGVIAIILTIMVLEIKRPESAEISALIPTLPLLFSYVLSFVGVGIYWNNHHHLFYAAKRINGTVMWANLHLLFWLTLVPFVTEWMGENFGARWPTFFYGAVLWMAGFAYNLLQQSIVKTQDKDSALAQAIGHDMKGLMSLVIYTVGVILAFIGFEWLAFTLYIVVALMWFIPDRRIEKGELQT